MHTKLGYRAGGGDSIASCFTIGRRGVAVGLSNYPALARADVISAPADTEGNVRGIKASTGVGCPLALGSPPEVCPSSF